MQQFPCFPKRHAFATAHNVTIHNEATRQHVACCLVSIDDSQVPLPENTEKLLHGMSLREGKVRLLCKFICMTAERARDEERSSELRKAR